jgi:hypothetical protein
MLTELNSVNGNTRNAKFSASYCPFFFGFFSENSQLHTLSLYHLEPQRSTAAKISRMLLDVCVCVCVCVCACVLPVGAAHCSRKKSPAWRCVCVKVHRASALRRGIFLCRGKQHARGNARKKETPACDRACVWRPCAGFWLSKKRSVLRN